MKSAIGALIPLLILAGAISIAMGLLERKLKRGRKGPLEIIRSKAVLTEREKPMFRKLQEALPKAVVLAQVSFGALLDAKLYGTRSRFDRKMADFVVLNQDFEVLAIIELDDTTHIGRESKDADRDKMLRDAGYMVRRYRSIPSAEEIRMDFRRIIEQRSTNKR